MKTVTSDESKDPDPGRESLVRLFSCRGLGCPDRVTGEIS